MGTVDFDPGAGTTTLTSAAGSADVFVSKLDSSGNFVWAKSFGGTSEDLGYSIAVDSSGNIYTTGYFYSTADFDPGAGTSNRTSAGLVDVFVSKLDSSGNFVWAKSFGGTRDDVSNSIAVDSSGNVYTTGFFVEIVDFDPGAGTSNHTSAGGGDVFVSKLDSSGNFVWAKSFGGTSGDSSSSIAVDSSGNIYTAGSFGGTVDFDPGAGTTTLSSAGDADVFVLKLTSAGEALALAVPASTFSSASSYDGRFTVQVSNYDSAYTYAVTSTAGQASINSTGLVTVTGLGKDQSVTVTVTTTRTGYTTASASITGRSQVAAMTPSNKPTVTLSDTLITCTIGSYSATPTSSAFSLFVDGKHVSTIFSALGEYLPDWIIPWATSSTITRTATLTSATWAMSDAYKGKSITCATLAYSKNAIGFTASQVMVAR